jgi:hypothetical protein
MMPIVAPGECWATISMDWITGLPKSNGYDAILTVVDKLSKRPKYIPTQSTHTAVDTAKIFFEHVVRHHGLPTCNISNRDPKFTSSFGKELMKVMGINQAMTSVRRLQADGASERQNRTLEDALICQISYHGQDWSEHLGTIEYEHQGLVQASTGFTTFEIGTGRKLKNSAIGITQNNMAKNFAEN